VLITTLTETAPAEEPSRLIIAAGKHAAIVAAIADRDPITAAAAMTDVIEEGRRNRMTDLPSTMKTRADE
jgi:DNA-binding FadR family transcriptional regulator